MKTPREILVTRHQSAMPALDAIRLKTVGHLAAEDKSQPKASLAAQIWAELILPCRRLWTGLAAVWVCLIIFNFSQRDGPHPVMTSASTATESATAFRDQQRVLNELLADRSIPMEAVRSKTYTPKPRSEAIEFLTT